MSENNIPLWIKTSYTAIALIIFPVYLYKYGASNFLWFSDIAFFVMVPAIWFKSRIIASMMAIGVLPIEIIWLVSLFTGGAFLGIANYMYDPALPLWLRFLSFYHFPMIAVIVYMIYRFGYDRCALVPQIICSLFIIFLTYNFSDKADNINMIYPPKDIAPFISDRSYLFFMPFALILLFIMPTHFILKKFFPLKTDRKYNEGE